MAYQFTTVPIEDLGAGIDKQSAENQIKPGYCEDLLNVDPKPEGYLVKRPGYQGHCGFVPVRVAVAEYTDDSTENLCFTLDQSIDLSTTRSTPIVVFGRNSSDNGNNAGDFTQHDPPNFFFDSAQYYPGFTADVRKTFLTGANTLTIDADEHGKTTDNLFVGVTKSTSINDNSNTQFEVKEIRIDQTTFDIDIDYVNSTGSTFEGFVYVSDKDAVAGQIFVSGASNQVDGVLTTTTIPQATHNLGNNNIIVKAYKDDGTDSIELVPDQVRILTNGNVEIDIVNNSGADFSAFFILSAAPATNIESGTANATSSLDVVITGLTSDFLFIGAYFEPTIGGTLESIIPDSVVINSATNTATITIFNGAEDSRNFQIYYEESSIATNKLCVDASVIGPGDVYTDDRPQLTIWGLDHRDIYGSGASSNREGWVTHIDTYRSTGEAKLVSGLGGNLFEEGLRTSLGTTYLLPQLFPSLSTRVATTVDVAPVFFSTADSPSRTRGFIQSTNGGSSFVPAETISYDSVEDAVKYTLTLPGKTITGTLQTSPTPLSSDTISTVSGLQDQLTIKQAGQSVNNGTFTIKKVADGVGDTIDIWVTNASVDDSRFDETDSGALVGIFTDQITLTDSSPFLDGDRVKSGLFDDSDLINVVSSSGTTTVVNGIIEELTVGVGLRLVGLRTSFIMPIRNLTRTDLVTNLVKGDMITYTGTERQLRIRSINTNSDLAITTTGDGTLATITLGSGDTSRFEIGKKVLLLRAGTYSGVQTITGIPSTTTLTFASTSTAAAVAGTLKGKTIELDENFQWEDSVGSSIDIRVDCRWIPIEAPDDNFNLTPSTYVNYFDSSDYEKQNYLRSTMVSDNLYLTNGDDEVYKYDGVNNYRAGLFRWQPHLFVTTDLTPATGGKIDVPTVESGIVIAAAGTEFKVPIGTEQRFIAGDQIKHTTDGTIYTIDKVSDNGTDGLVFVTDPITGAAPGTLQLVQVYKYYFRLNAIDANQNIIASAYTGGLGDFNLELTDDVQVRIRLVGMPAWDTYDYDKLEVEIYRTKANGTNFFRLSTIAMNFDSDGGYIDYVDTDSDNTLLNPDPTITLRAGELGTGFAEPLKAKYVTSAANRLILGNLTDYPELDIRLIKGPNEDPTIEEADLAGDIWTFRIANTDSGTTTDMLSRANYETVTTSTAITSIATSTGVSFTVTVANSLSAGDWVYLFRDSVFDGAETRFMGWWQVASATGTDFTINFSDAPAAATADDVNRVAFASTTADIPVFLGTDGNYGMSNGNTSGTYEFLAMRRLANAINTSMRKVDTSISGYEDFSPWLIANAGNEFNFGQLIVRTPKVLATTPGVKLPTFSGFSLFVNNISRNSDTEVSMSPTFYPSRIIVSYSNFPEIFDSPRATLDSQSPSAIDVNSADGQEITGIIPFFGEAAFGSAQKSGIVVVFKTNSIYLVDLAQKDSQTAGLGGNPVQKIESQGLGCTAPYSIAVTRDGIVFANESGIFRLTRSLTIEFVGQKIERLWEEELNRDQLAIAQGHHFATGRQYKLSVPITGSTSNSNVLVYNHTREYRQQGFGSWTEYDNHPATGWANLETDAFFSSTTGDVFILRQTGLKFDFRDDSKAISMEALLPALNFGDGGRRKIVSKILTHFRGVEDMVGTTLSSAVDLTEQFDNADDFELDVNDVLDQLSDLNDFKIKTLRFSINRRKCIYMQVKFTNSTIDEPVEIAGVEFRVAGMKTSGITEAKDSKTGT